MKVVLGYSGGLDTSVIVPWLKENYGAEVICMAGDVGQQGGPRRARAEGARHGGIGLLRRRPPQRVRRRIRVANAQDRGGLRSEVSPGHGDGTADSGAAPGRDRTPGGRGCAGARLHRKGNDQVRFELAYSALASDLDVIAPWREWDLKSREECVEYAHARNIPLDGIDETKLYSRDENLWHISHEGGPLEDPAFEPEESMYLWDCGNGVDARRAGAPEHRLRGGRPCNRERSSDGRCPAARGAQ